MYGLAIICDVQLRLMEKLARQAAFASVKCVRTDAHCKCTSIESCVLCRATMIDIEHYSIARALAII